MNNLSFEKVVPDELQIRTLFELLKMRRHSISHFELPTYTQHQLFVKNNPYILWFIVELEYTPIGSFYIQKDNSVGINLVEVDAEIVLSIVEFIRSNFQPKTAVKSKVPPYFFVNTSYEDDEMKCAFNQLKIEPLQISYRI